MKAKAIVPAAAEVTIEVGSWGVEFTGTKDALIAKGICREEHFPIPPKRVRRSHDAGNQLPGDWEMRRLAGGRYELRAWDRRGWQPDAYWSPAWGAGCSTYQQPSWDERYCQLLDLRRSLDGFLEWLKRNEKSRRDAIALAYHDKDFRREVFRLLNTAWWLAGGGEENYSDKRLPAAFSPKGFAFSRDTYDEMVEHFEALTELVNHGATEEFPEQRARIRLRGAAANDMTLQIVLARMEAEVRDHPLREDAA